MTANPRPTLARRLRPPPPSTRARAATFLVVLFVAAFTLSGVATWLVLSQPITAGVEARLAREATTLTRLYGQQPFSRASEAIRAREHRASGLKWRLATGRRAAGDLPLAAQYRPGLQTMAVGAPRIATLDEENAGDGDEDDGQDRLRVLTVAWPAGGTLSLGEDVARLSELKRQFLRAFLLTSGAGLMIALGLTLSFASRVLGRIESISRTADAVSGEDMGVRVPVRSDGRGDDIDRLAQSVNRMLDRIAGLLASLRQVSDDVAHDLRTPLTHLKQRVETALSGPPNVDDYRAALEGASDKIDEVLATFEALLSIARLEAGATLHLQPVDVSAVAAAVVEAFRPSAEDGGRELILSAPHPAMVQGERALLTQMLANLIENALIHTPEGSSVEVRAESLGPVVRLAVEDDGPGVPDAERRRIFERFFRVERSRTTPGSGLGLSLVAAVAAAHGAEIRAEDAAPGLAILIDFPAPEPLQA